MRGRMNRNPDARFAVAAMAGGIAILLVGVIAVEWAWAATDLTSGAPAVTARISGTFQRTAEGRTARLALAHEVKESFTFGTGSAKCDQVFTDIRLLAKSSNEDLDLAGTLLNFRGGTITFTAIKAILIHNRTDETLTDPSHTATTATLRIGTAAANGWAGPFVDASDRLDLAEGESVLLIAPGSGWSVTADTGDLLNVANQDGANEGCYEITVIGDNN